MVVEEAEGCVNILTMGKFGTPSPHETDWNKYQSYADPEVFRMAAGASLSLYPLWGTFWQSITFCPSLLFLLPLSSPLALNFFDLFRLLLYHGQQEEESYQVS